MLELNFLTENQHIMLIQDLLFGKDKFDCRSPRQIEMENLYISKGYDFEPIFKEALARILKDDTPASFRGRGYNAYHMNWMVIGILKELYPKLMKVDEEKRNYFQLDKNVRVYFKKLDSKHRPENVVTGHVKNLNSMRLLFNEEATTVLYAGFRLREDKYWDDFTGCFLVEMKHLKRTNWVSKLEDLAFEISKNQPTTTPIFKADIPSEITFKADSKRKSQDK